MTRPLWLCGAAAIALLATPVDIMAQQQATKYRIGYLTQTRQSDAMGDLAALRRNLRNLGYTEAGNLQIEARFAEERIERIADLAAELARFGPRLIVVPNAGVAEIVLASTNSIPIVVLAAGQLEAVEGVAHLAKPGGRLTGMQLFSPDSMGKRLQLLREIVPNLQRVAVLRGVPFDGPGFALYRDATEAAAASLGIRARYVQFGSPADLGRLFDEMAREHDQAVLVWGNPHIFAHRQEIQRLTMRHRLPAIYDADLNPDALLTYTAAIDPVWKEAATYVDRILKGAQPGDLPIGQARTFTLTVNLKTAKALGLTIPRSLLLRADEVIQ